jgi:hypothetical protein
MEPRRQWRVRYQPGAVAVTVLFVLFLANLIAGVTQGGARSGIQVVVGGTGMFACVVLFLIGVVINRLE